MAQGDTLKAYVSVERIRYYKDDTNWGIVDVSIDEIKEGVPYKKTEVCCKGIMTAPIVGNQYYMNGIECNDSRWGQQYELTYFGALTTQALNDRYGQRKFLMSLFTERQVAAMYEALPDPFQAFYDGDIESLVKIKGCGSRNAINWMNKFNDNYTLGRIYIELEEYNLTNAMIQKLIKKFKSSDLVVENVRKNPYVLTELDGVGFIRADEYAMRGGIDKFSTTRVKAFILYYLEQQGLKGFSYVRSQDLMDALLGTLGEELPDLVISDSIRELGDKIWYDDSHENIGLMQYRKLEESIARELLRIKNGQNNFKYDNWMDTIARLEALQGWKFTEEQITASKMALDNNLLIVHGQGGTGKTTVVEAMVKILKNYSVAQCALAGRASARMTEVTGIESYTIHRLLGYPCRYEDAKNQFEYHDENPLWADIVVLDEVSMVDGYLFYYLLRAIPTGSKLIMLGDFGQLESIGCCNVAYDMIKSPIVPSIYLSQIHRQAAKSAIITESRKVYNGEQIVDKDWTGVGVRGELQDLVIDCYSDRNNTFFRIMEHFAKELNEVDSILNLQIVLPIKEKGQACTYVINNAVQELYNPAEDKKNEIYVSYSRDIGAILREGDKVMSVKNNRNVLNIDGIPTPIFNGNIGIIEEINLKENYMVIDFIGIDRVVINRDFYKNIELAYATTTHKNQGSQYDRVIVAYDFTAYSSLTKEQVYTAMTRAKKHCILIAETGALRYAISQTSVNSKLTHLQEILIEMSSQKNKF